MAALWPVPTLDAPPPSRGPRLTRRFAVWPAPSSGAPSCGGSRSRAPSNTTAYAAGDTIAGTLIFPEVVEADRAVYLIGGSVQTSKKTSIEVFRLHLYSDEPATFLDGASMAAARVAERETYLGSVVFPAAARIGNAGEAFTALAPSSTPVALVVPAGDLYGVLEGTLGETPDSGQIYVVSLVMEQN